MLDSSFRNSVHLRGFSHSGPQDGLLVITTASCMRMPVVRSPKEWLDFALQGVTYGEFGDKYVRYPPLERDDILNALSVMEILKQPSISLDTQGEKIEMVWQEKWIKDIKDGPSVYPMYAIKGRLYGWKLWAVEPKAKGELWLHFIEMGTLRHESWQAVLAEGRGTIPELAIYKADNHYYEYRYVKDEELVEIHEWFKSSDGSPRLVRSFEMELDGAWKVFESDI